MLLDTVLCDRQCLAVWDGPATTPLWLSAVLGAGVLFGLVAALLGRDETPAALQHRLAALFCLTFAAIMTFSQLPVAHHHLVTLLPAAAVVVVLALGRLTTRYRAGKVVAGAFAIVYFGAAMFWSVALIRGLERTGGTDSWSDAIYFVSDYLETHKHGREVKILDWGLHNNLFVLPTVKSRPRSYSGRPTPKMPPSGNLGPSSSKSGIFI